MLQKMNLFFCQACVVLCILCVVNCHQISTEFDATTLIKFPQLRNLSANKVEPVGHLKYFGQQRPPLGQIPEYFTSPTPRFLWDYHIKTYR